MFGVLSDCKRLVKTKHAFEKEENNLFLLTKEAAGIENRLLLSSYSSIYTITTHNNIVTAIVVIPINNVAIVIAL